MPTTQPDPTTMEPVELTTTPPSSTEAPPPVVTIGEVGGPGEPLAPQSGSTTAVIHEHPLPDGAILRYRLYVAVPDADVRLQVWRPQQRGETQREEEGEVYLLVYDKLYMFEEPGMKVVTLEDPVIVREYDRLGFTTSPDSTNSLIGHFVPTDENPAYQEVVMIREAPPTVELGRNYTFTGRFNIGFYIAADVDTVTNYTTDGIPGAPKTADDTALSTAAIIIIAVCAGLLLLFLLVCILCIAKRKRQEYPVEDYQPPVYETAPKEWVITRENVNLYETLSETEAGLVVKGEVYGMHAKQGWSTVAIKLLKDTAGEYEKKAMLQEIESMKVIRPHHHVLQLLGCAIDRDPILLIAEYCAFGNLQDYLRDLKDRNLYMNIAGHSNYTITQELVGFMAQVARGMAYLSSMRILHRDLATRNILISDGRMCKITHFGFARDVIENHNYERLAKMRLPVRWLSPEALLSSNYSIKSDVWSMGVLMWEVVTLGATPYQNLDTDQVIKCVKKGYRLDKPPHCGDLLYGVMKKCWKTRAQERTTFELLSDNLQKLLDENNEMIQLEHYPEGQYHYLTSSSDHEIV